MNADVMAEWFRRRGCRLLRSTSSYWYEASPRVYQAFPFHWLIEPSEQELRSLLVANRAIALRYSTPLTAPVGKVSYHMVCDEPAYCLKNLPRQVRQNVRHGLDYARIEPITLSRLAEEGWRLRQETLARQGRASAEDEVWWRRLCLSAEGLPGFEAWGALHEGQLAASFLAFHGEGCFTLLYEQSTSESLGFRVNNAIYFAVTQAAFQHPDVSFVFSGLHSLDADAGIDQFKLRMGFTARPVRQRVVFHPLLAPLCRPGHRVIRSMLNSGAHSPMLTKTEGMMRFYLEGRRNLDQQDWPECLAACKDELLKVLEAAPPAGKPALGRGVAASLR